MSEIELSKAVVNAQFTEDIPAQVPETDSGHRTARRAVALAVKKFGLHEPTPVERLIIVRAFLDRKKKTVHPQSFDLVNVSPNVSLDDQRSVEQNLEKLVLYEVKSTRKKKVKPDFSGYFFSLSTAELLVAQVLGPQYRFLLINVNTEARIELSLKQLLAQARSLYPSWSIQL